MTVSTPLPTYAPSVAGAESTPPPKPPPTAQTPSPPTTRPTSDRRLERGTLIALLACTAVLYIWGLGASGYASSFYSAAAQAGSQDWTAWFFGSLDSGNSITVDKPPASLWVMGLSVRLFGLSSWSILVPEALMGDLFQLKCRISRL